MDLAKEFLEEMQTAGLGLDVTAQHTILSTCSEEELPFFESALDTTADEVAQRAHAYAGGRQGKGAYGKGAYGKGGYGKGRQGKGAYGKGAYGKGANGKGGYGKGG